MQPPCWMSQRPYTLPLRAVPDFFLETSRVDLESYLPIPELESTPDILGYCQHRPALPNDDFRVLRFFSQVPELRKSAQHIAFAGTVSQHSSSAESPDPNLVTYSG